MNTIIQGKPICHSSKHRLALKKFREFSIKAVQRETSCGVIYHEYVCLICNCSDILQRRMFDADSHSPACPMAIEL